MIKKIEDIRRWNEMRKDLTKKMQDAIENTDYCSAKIRLRALNNGVERDIDYLLDLIELVPEELT